MRRLRTAVGEYRPREQGLRLLGPSHFGSGRGHVGEYRPREQGLRRLTWCSLCTRPQEVGEYRPREQGLRHFSAIAEILIIAVGEYRPREQGLRLVLPLMLLCRLDTSVSIVQENKD